MEITRREIIVSIIIVLLMISIGFLLSPKIYDSVSSSNEKYFKSLKVHNDPVLFDYAINTNVGNILSQGVMIANEPVKDEMIEGDYFSIIKKEQHYVMKTRVVTYTDSEGNLKTRTETYWEWDTVNKERFDTETLTYLERIFPLNKFNINHHDYNTTVKTSMSKRFVFYTIPKEFEVSVFSKTANKNIEDNRVYHNISIERFLEIKEAESKSAVTIFWIAWILITILVTFAFYYLENKFINNY